MSELKDLATKYTVQRDLVTWDGRKLDIAEEAYKTSQRTLEELTEKLKALVSTDRPYVLVHVDTGRYLLVRNIRETHGNYTSIEVLEVAP
jgi:hypothetical protein